MLQWKDVKKDLACGHCFFVLESWETWPGDIFVHRQCSLPNLQEGVEQNGSSFCTFFGQAVVIFLFVLKMLLETFRAGIGESRAVPKSRQ